ncbi:hypothetical protein GCM10022207_42870 [Streptomyces lannensis]|uniref:Uncharacterized protein n=1 Tax=Streptomyces lannensis TaxID=766498 RepID=A0ABP7KEG3_9ACTN
MRGPRRRCRDGNADRCGHAPAPAPGASDRRAPAGGFGPHAPAPCTGASVRPPHWNRGYAGVRLRGAQRCVRRKTSVFRGDRDGANPYSYLKIIQGEENRRL